jgi:xanthine dehydrogenase accessory factor
MKKILKETIRLLEKEESVVWATVVDHKGSTPRKAATRMLISSTGDTLGSVGGGRLEAETLETARAIHKKPDSQLLDISMTGQEVAETEMICGGRAKIFVEHLSPEALPFVRELYERISREGESLFLTWIGKKKSFYGETHFIFKPNRKMNEISGMPYEIAAEVEKTLAKGMIPAFIVHPERDGFLFVESLKRSSTLYIFGGGHISLDLAWMAERVGFQVIVVDDRKAFASRERFPMALDLWAMPYKEALEDLQLEHDDFVVIVTRGHLHDLDVLRGVIVQSPQYIGMIGSRRKKAMIFDRLQKEGISQKRLDEIHAPVGLDIRAETPAEISVSIVAEMIQVRGESRGPGKKNWHV